MNTLKLDLEAQALSDWSIRAGYGLTKRIDSAVIRDGAGLPYLPAKTLVGIIRERATQIAKSLDEEIGEAKWSPWVTYVFGSRPDSQQRTSAAGSSRELPRPAHLEAAALRMTTAARSLEFAQALGISTTELHKATTIARASTKIDGKTGTAEQGSLRVEERARAGIKLRGEWSLVLDNCCSVKDVWPALFLLASAVKTTTHVGGKRRRGSGEFTFSLSFSSDNDSSGQGNRLPSGSALEWLLKDLGIGSNELCNPPAVPQMDEALENATNTPGTSSTTARELKKVGTLYLETMSPLISSPTKKGTVVTSSSYISGSTILGLAQRGLGVPGSDIRDSNFIVTHAYPSVGRGQAQRSIPWPLALARRKGSTTGEISNKFVWHEFDPKLKPAADSFVAPTDTEGTLVETTVAKVSHTHASIKPGTDPELFEYRAIETGVEFAAEIWWDKDLAEINFPAQTRLGTSHKDDYGLTRVRFVPAESPAAQQKPQEPSQISIAAGSEFNLVLTSDVLLSGSDGNPDPTAEALLRELEDTLGLEHGSLTVAEPGAAEMGSHSGKIRQALIANTARHDSWQVTWGLPRPTLIGLAAGSVIRLKAAQKIDSEALSRLNRGIGNRTAEGYGRVLVNPAFLELEKLTALPIAELEHLETSPANNTEIDSTTRAVILQAVLLDRVSQISLLSKQAVSKFLPLKSEVSSTQLNQLRELSHAIGTPAVTTAINAWSKENKLNSQQKSQLLELFSLPDGALTSHPALRELDLIENGEEPIYETSSSDIFAAYIEAASNSPEGSTKPRDLLKAITKSMIMFLVKTAQKSANERN